MRLADFIDHNVDAIVAASEDFAQTLLPAAAHLDPEGLRDHIPMILHAVAADLRLPQTAEEQMLKSLGRKSALHGAPETAAQTHALLRAKSGFDIQQMVGEYRVLRATVLRLWMNASEPLGDAAHDDIVRFNEAIDQAVAESVTFYTAEVDRWRHVFLGVLGHDLRGPLNAILLTSELLSRMTTAAPLSTHTLRLIQSGRRMKGLLDDLLDFSRASLGLGMAIRRAPVDLEAACADELDVLRAALPDCPIAFEVEGDTRGSFDASRVREVLGNLVTNAARYCTPGTVVRVQLAGAGDKVSLSVENSGSPIPGETLNDLFEPLRRGNEEPAENFANRANLGLGLFIVREIARAHGGEVHAVSTEGATRFTMTLPRAA
ncbi:sensor histidine kinase [Variovorax sp. PBL-E5]|uniref:sensor histidine kinase n=1 Tax=Variovorax sp. PBL-E5 TaxID=434014 RepID=UPI0013198FCB|nr:HAMP domain-containing sensor histidine kinase [Variovorax sp. PBL-E5]VTU16307.1 Bacteriophytochrome [Variovorax sp. PBL-E5]